MRTNRNVCLFLGQILFLTVVGIIDFVSEAGCIAITYISHYVWLSAFCWMTVEGFIILIAHEKPLWLDMLTIQWYHFAFGYGAPLVISLVTFSPAYFSDNGYYR